MKYSPEKVDICIEGDIGKNEAIQLKYGRNTIEIHLPGQCVSTVFLGINMNLGCVE